MSTMKRAWKSPDINMPILLFLASLYFALHVFTNGNYGIFRDELYYLACADHLDWGYVDHPGLSILLLKISRGVLGDSVTAIRILPALAGSAFIILTGLIALELGGKRFAQGLAALCACIVPVYLAMFGYYSMNAFNLLVWAVAFYLVLRIVNTDNQALWLWLGVLLGLGLMNKLSVLFFGFGLVVSLLATQHRKLFLKKEAWIGGMIAMLLFLPYVIWQVFHDWATLEFMRNAKQYKIAAMSPRDFLLGQVLEVHPFNALIWLTGVIALLFAKPLRKYRLFGIMYIALFFFFVVQKSKAYYLTPVYPILLAAGAVAIELYLVARVRWSRFVIVGVLVLGGFMTLPLALPVLPPEMLIAYQHKIGAQTPPNEMHRMPDLPQHFADRFDWQNMAQTVASVYETLSPEQQQQCVMYASNYGEAGAIEYYRSFYNLPPVISGHNNYYLWGYGETSGKVIISVGFPLEELQAVFHSVTLKATIISPYAMPYETNLPVYLCLDIKVPLEQVWTQTKNYI